MLFLYFLFFPAYYQLGAGVNSSSAGSALFQVFWVLVFANSVLLAALRKGISPGLLWALGWLLPLA